VGETSERHASAAPAGGLARRQFLLKAAVAGTAVWVVPSIIAIQPAGAADLNSRPPKHVDQVVDPIAKPPPAVADTQLPFTGDDSDDLIIAGLAATAAGASLMFLTHAGAHMRLEGAIVEES
jgi:hypothetical protein